MHKRHSNPLLCALLLLVLSACASAPKPDPLEATIELFDVIESGTPNPQFMQQLYESRSWLTHRHLGEDPLELGIADETPIQSADIRFVGPTDEDALRSLALKIWMIENAEHTIDAVYYIFAADMAGLAVLGALCNAVIRGVDVRLVVDSVGSLSLKRAHLRALRTCADDGGFMKGPDGGETTLRARIQSVVFNALSNPVSRINRRSHDKMLVADGAFPDKAIVLTGGRNISTAYYGIQSDGAEDPYAFRDLEILVRPGGETSPGHLTVGNISEAYFSLLFLNQGNKLIKVASGNSGKAGDEHLLALYRKHRASAQQQLQQLKEFPLIAGYFEDMPEYVEDMHKESEVLLAHELANLADRKVVREAVENRERNPNSIMKIIMDPETFKYEEDVLKIASPYLFLPRYLDGDGNVLEDSVASIHQWLDEDPDNRIEIITNSVLTSGNVLAQSVVDMEVGPRLLLTPELQQAWLSGLKKGELNPEVTGSEEWRTLVEHPQIFLYQTGKLDAYKLGGEVHYGKLHAKFLMGDTIGFVGTSNFDYRSILYNNEVGFFYRHPEAHAELNGIFDALKETAYRWGTPEWLEMRRKVMDQGGIKGLGTKNQRSIYKLLGNTGLIWLI